MTWNDISAGSKCDLFYQKAHLEHFNQHQADSDFLHWDRVNDIFQYMNLLHFSVLFKKITCKNHINLLPVWIISNQIHQNLRNLFTSTTSDHPPSESTIFQLNQALEHCICFNKTCLHKSATLKLINQITIVATQFHQNPINF